MFKQHEIRPKSTLADAEFKTKQKGQIRAIGISSFASIHSANKKITG
jgi:hypothetical protein